MMIIYGLKNCDTCRKALKSLPDARLCDVRAEGVPASILESAYEMFGGDLLNTRSATWRELDVSARGLAPLELLTKHPTLMKRPLIEHQGRLYLGWTNTVQAALLG